MSRASFKNSKSRPNLKAKSAAQLKGRIDPYVAFLYVLGEKGVEVTQEVDLANKPVSDKLHFFGAEAMTWLEEHYKITPEESVALLEQMRQENLIVNSKDPTAKFAFNPSKSIPMRESSPLATRASLSKMHAELDSDLGAWRADSKPLLKMKRDDVASEPDLGNLTKRIDSKPLLKMKRDPAADTDVEGGAWAKRIETKPSMLKMKHGDDSTSTLTPDDSTFDIFGAPRSDAVSGTASEQWTTTGPKVMFSGLKVESMLAFINELREKELIEMAATSPLQPVRVNKKKNKDVPVAPKNSTVSNIIALMEDYGVTAVPVPTHHHNIAMVGVMDIVVHAVEVFDALPDDAKIKSKFADVATEQLLSNTSRTPYRALYLDTSVKELLQTMAELRMHDLAISDRSNNIVAVINEYEVMRFLARVVHHFALSSTTLDDYSFAFKKILHIDTKTTAVEAFRRLDTLNMRRLAVVDEFNSVQETITVHDIIKIGTNAEFDDQFRDKLTDFMPWAREWASYEAVSVPPTAKIGDICRKFIAEQAQAIFVAQKGKLRPNRARLRVSNESALDHFLGVVTISDVVQLVASSFGETATDVTEPSRVKVVVIGDPGPAKNDAVALLAGPENSSSLESNLFTVNNDSVIFHVWNFPLQRSEHTAVQFFLSGRGVYVIAHKYESPVESLIEWCRALNVHSPRAPVLVLVATPKSVKTKDFDKFKAPLIKRLSNYRVSDILQCSPKVSAKNTRELRDQITKFAEKFKLLHTQVPLPLIQAISYRKQQMIISVPEFSKLARISGDKKDSLHQAIQLLNDAGVILRFENDATLKDLIIVDISIFYKLLTILNQLTHGNPVISNQKLLATFKGVFQEAIFPTVINLLEAFEVVYKYRAGDMDLWIIPSLVAEMYPDEVVGNWDFGPNMFYRIYQFRFTPFALFSRVLVLTMSLFPPENITAWSLPPDTDLELLKGAKRQGMLLEVRSVECLIEYDDQSNQLHVKVRAIELGLDDPGADSAFMANLAMNIDNLFNVFYSLEQRSIERKLVCPFCAKQAKEPHFVLYKDLVLLQQKGLDNLTCDVAGKPLKIARIAPDLVFAQVPTIVDVKVISVLGTGAFGTVSLGERADGSKVALKELITVPEDADNEDVILEKYHEFHHEVFIMSLVRHPYLLTMHGVSFSPLRIVMDLAPCGVLGEILYNETIPDNAIPLSLRLKICLDIAKGMRALHDIRPAVVHRDLRSFNVFMNSYNPDHTVTAKVGDFGLSTTCCIALSDILATWQWLAPEVTEPNSRYDETSDIYSYGVVVYEIMSRNLPFTEFEEFLQRTEQPLTEAQLKDVDLMLQLRGAGFEIRGGKAVREEFLVHRIKTAILNGLRPIMPASAPPFLQALVQLCWNATPTNRPSFKEIVNLLSTRLGVPDNYITPPAHRRRPDGADVAAPWTAGADSKLAEALTLDMMDVVIRGDEGPMVHERLVLAIQASKQSGASPMVTGDEFELKDSEAAIEDGADKDDDADAVKDERRKRRERKKSSNKLASGGSSPSLSGTESPESAVVKIGKSRDLRVPGSEDQKRKVHRSKSSRGGTSSGSSSKRSSGVVSPPH